MLNRAMILLINFILVSLFYLNSLCDIHHKKESTPHFLTNQYFYVLNHKKIKLLFIFILPETTS
ncbi:hypothetical protein CIT292_10579 [Citrobacter youngae ATCC 29220]|uniref:Uncharacterized protein n=1 Tax=Citrobacter youngae ATCC 29220 TaxID=500640 RepID=D4BJ62_9ENTR|nr:hypothetical protein CIT292_10579 [Citrobacter youngae ATCC 29220]